MSDTAGSSSSSDKAPPNSNWIRDYFPIKLRQVGEGPFAANLDERCVTWCSQTSRGRSLNEDPKCQTICLRYVYPHEVTKQHDLIPLPPEGQPEEAITQGRVGGIGAQNVQYYKEGWYLWRTSFWVAGQDRMGMMRWTLPEQLNLMRLRENSERQRVLADQTKPQDVEARPLTAKGLKVRRVTYPELISESQLIPLTPLPAEIYDSISRRLNKTMQPSYRALEIFQDAYRDGAFGEIGESMWDKLKTREAFGMTRDLLFQTWERWKGPKDDDDDGDDTKGA